MPFFLSLFFISRPQKMMPEKDLYACLGVERTCGDSDIRKVQLTFHSTGKTN
jgi:hypothetical protein